MKDCRIVKADCVGSSICILDTRMCQCVHVYLYLCVLLWLYVCVCAMGISIQDTYNMHLYNFNHFYTYGTCNLICANTWYTAYIYNII